MDDYIMHRKICEAGRAAEALGLPKTSDRLRILRKKLDVMKRTCENDQLLYKARWLEAHLDNTRNVFHSELHEHGERIEEEKAEEVGKLKGMAAILNAFLLFNIGAFFAQFACESRAILNSPIMITFNIIASFTLVRLVERAMGRIERSKEDTKAIVHDAMDGLMLCVRDLLDRLSQATELSQRK